MYMQSKMESIKYRLHIEIAREEMYIDFAKRGI